MRNSIVFVLLLSAAIAWGDVKLTGGSLRVRGETASKTDFVNTKEFYSLRARLDFTATQEGFSAFVQPQFSKYLGAVDYVPGATGNTATQTSGTVTDSAMTLHQAYMTVPFSDFELMAGRSVLSYGDELVLGAQDWSNVGRSFDGARLRYKSSFGNHDLIGSKLVETNVSSTTNGDYDLLGFYNSLAPGFVDALDVYFLYLRDQRTVTPPDSELSNGGLRVKSAVDAFDYRAEYVQQWGTSYSSATATYLYSLDSLINAEAGYKVSGLGGTRFSLEGSSATEKFNQLFATGHKWLGYADVFSRRNISEGVLHIRIPWSNTFLTDIDGHYFMRTSSGAAVYKYSGAALGTAGGSSSNDLGQEVDLTGKWTVSEKLIVSAGAAVFNPGSYIKDQFNGVSPVFYYTQIEGHF